MRRGFSLSETVIASFLLLCACVVFVALLHSMLNVSVRAEEQARASLLAEKRLEQVRQWIYQNPDSFDKDPDWAAMTGPSADPYYPDFTMTTQVFPLRLYVPCSGLGGANSMDNSLRQVKVTVNWPGHQLALVSQMAGGPVRPVRPVITGTIPSLVLKNQGVDFSVALDQGAAAVLPVPDITFHWYVQPITGNGHLELLDPRGSQVRFVHSVKRPDGSFSPVTGLEGPSGGYRRCRLQMHVRYFGQDFWRTTGDISLEP